MKIGLLLLMLGMASCTTNQPINGTAIDDMTVALHQGIDGNMALDDMDKFIIKTALERANNNLTAAARALGATRETLRYRVRKYNLKTED